MAGIPNLTLRVEPETFDLAATRSLASFRKGANIRVNGADVSWDLPDGVIARVGFADSYGRPERLSVPNILEFCADHTIDTDAVPDVAVEIVGFAQDQRVRHWSSRLNPGGPTAIRGVADEPLDEVLIQIRLANAGTLTWEQTSLTVGQSIPATTPIAPGGNWETPIDYLLEQVNWEPRFADTDLQLPISRSERLIWHGFFGVGQALTSDPAILNVVVSELLAWDSLFGDMTTGDDMAWDDMAVSSRTLSLAHAIERLDGIDGRLRSMQLVEMLDQHGQWLSLSSNYAAAHNHGLFADIALTVAGRTLPRAPYAEHWLRTARERFADSARRVFNWDEATVMEHSPGYVATLSVLTDNAREVGLTVPHATAPLFEDTIAAMTTPDGFVAPIGDTWIDELGRSPQPPGVSVFPETGWYAYHNKTSSLFIQSGYHSPAHKHADDGSPLLFLNGRWVLFEVGHPGYERSSGDRAIGTAATSHNTVEFDDEPSTWADKPPSGSGIVATGEGDGWAIVEVAPAISPTDVRHRRFVAYQPGSRLVVVDNVADASITSVRQYWHLGPGLELAKDGRIIDPADPGRTVARFGSWALSSGDPGHLSETPRSGL